MISFFFLIVLSESKPRSNRFPNPLTQTLRHRYDAKNDLDHFPGIGFFCWFFFVMQKNGARMIAMQMYSFAVKRQKNAGASSKKKTQKNLRARMNANLLFCS